MKNTLTLLFVFISGFLFSQINILTSPDINSLSSKSNVFLDASSNYDPTVSNSNNTGKGLVFPQVDLRTFEFNLTDPVSDAILPTYYDGMVVYNIGTGKTISDTSKGGIQVEVKPGFYYFYNPNGKTNLNVTTGKWIRFGGGNNGGLANYINVTYVGDTGTWVQNYTADGNTISFKVSNNSNLSFNDLDFNNSVTLEGAKTGLSLVPSEDYSSVNMSAGSVKVFTYNVSGTPTDNGTLTANFHADGGLFAYGNIEITSQSDVRAIGLSFVGDYISNKNLEAADHSVALKIRNFSLNPLSNADLSEVINLSGVEGLTLLPNQNTNVTIQPNEEITLTYSLEGVAPKPGTLKATFAPNTEVSGNRSATQEVELFDNTTAQNMEIHGSYLWGQFMTPENKVTLEVTNNNTFDLFQIDLSEALILSGAVNNVKVTAEQNNSVDIAAGETKTITYVLSGTSMVENGGTLTATFNQAPFPAITAEKEVIGNNGFYATPSAITLPKDGGSYTFEITSSKPWEYEILNDNDDWISVTEVTGTDGNGTISITTTSKTIEDLPVGYIKIKRPNDGVSIAVAVYQEPVNNSLINGSGGISLSIHKNKPTTLTMRTTNFQIEGDIPDFIESYKIEGNKLILTPKERNTPGQPLIGRIKFNYGKGYFVSYGISQNQKAYKCPNNPIVNATKGYRIWNSTNKFDGSIFRILVETREGIDDFSDYSLFFYNPHDVGVSYETIQNKNQSSLFVAPFYNGNLYGFASGANYHKTYLINYGYLFRVNKKFGVVHSDNPMNNNIYAEHKDNAVIESVVVCSDGLDEDTPNVSGDAGWRK